MFVGSKEIHLLSFLTLSITFFIFTSTNAQWKKIPNFPADTVNCFTVENGILYAGTSGYGILKSIDGGYNWQEDNKGLSTPFVTSIYSSGKIILLGTPNNAYYRAKNDSNWINIGLYDAEYTFISDSIFFAGIGGDISSMGVYISKDYGKTWNNTTPYGISGWSFIKFNFKIYAGFTEKGVYQFDYENDNWLSKGKLPQIAFCFANIDSKLFAGTLGSGVYTSLDSGNTWDAVNKGLTNQYIWKMNVYGKNLFAGTQKGIFLSTNDGKTWESVNTGLPSIDIRSLIIADTNLIAGTIGSGLWIRPLTEMISLPTKLDLSNIFLNHFSLNQNYPNPFNPFTNIGFWIPDFGFVTLKVYDVLGREVAMLVNEEKPAGSYKVKFDGSNLSSGIYFYRLTAGNYTMVKKMVLMR